jgi:hypothetical protein
MAKYTCPPQSDSGSGTFSDNLVGLQITDGGGLTQGNFAFTTSVVQKTNRSFDTGVFSAPITLSSLSVGSEAQSQNIFDKNFRIYPNFDQTNVLNFVNYGSLVKRFEAAVTNIINFFPAGLEISKYRQDFTSGNTATGITFTQNENITTFTIPIEIIRNPFGIDFSQNAEINLNSLPSPVSPYRNLKTKYRSYILDINNSQYEVSLLTPSSSVSAGTLTLSVIGNPFSGSSTSSDDYVIRLNDTVVNEVFNLELDEVEEILLNRYSYPKYTAKFQVPTEGDDGTQFISFQNLTWPMDGQWNIDIRTSSFTFYLENLNEIGSNFDVFKTNLVSRFYVTDSFQEFDTPDLKVDKVLKIYGRSFDENKKYIDAIQYANSVNYNIGNDIPSNLVVNLAQTLGWSTNISPITNVGFLSSIYGTTQNAFPAYSTPQTINDLNNQYYRNLILNSAYLFKSKGTRKSIEFLMENIGVPDALLEFNENVYLADSKIDIEQFNTYFAQIDGGTYIPVTPVYNPNNLFLIRGIQYTAYTSSTQVINVDTTSGDYPIDEQGYPTNPTITDNFYFQKGEGWFESTPSHRSPQVIDNNTSVFTGSNPSVQTTLEGFTYGQKYLDRFREFPYMDLGFSIKKQVDNKKSWIDSNEGNRIGTDNIFDAYYYQSDDRLTLNVKNVDLFLNPAQAIAYDVWYVSRTKNYPIPITGLSSPYPQVGGVDSTFINPQPQNESFFKFYNTFWSEMINVRNRQYSSDGKTSGYPTLQSIFWKYLTMNEDVGLTNNNFNYQNMINYVNGIGDFWIRLVEQFVPATTIWNTGTKFENSVFHRQKFVYRRQRGCVVSTITTPSAVVSGPIAPVAKLNKSNNPFPEKVVPECPVGASMWMYQIVFKVKYIKGGDVYNMVMTSEPTERYDCTYIWSADEWQQFVEYTLSGHFESISVFNETTVATQLYPTLESIGFQIVIENGQVTLNVFNEEFEPLTSGSSFDNFKITYEITVTYI